jgi:hypothetical protein
MSIHGIARRSGPNGSATPTTAPVYVNSGNNRLRIIPAGSGSTEVELQPNDQQVLTAGTKTVVPATDGLYATFVFNLNSGITVTLPAATGSGAQYQFYVGLALSSNNYIVKVANANDYMRGVAWTTQDGGDTALSFDTADSGTVATESDTVTLNGGTTGGVVGSLITVRDIMPNIWFVELQNKATGSEATPFSATV